ncbi:MAG: NUDIX hydrolase [Ignavibacteriaceae bacterium]
MDYKIKKSEVLFKGKMIDLQVDLIEYKSGNTGVREVAVHPGGAVVVPVTKEGKIVLVSQFRYPLKKIMLELPAGKLDAGENPVVCAKRELEEETGFKSDSIEKLGKVHTSPGFCNEVLHLYIARNLVAGNHNREEGELGMEVFEFSFDEIDRKIKKGEITDAKTICGVYMAKRALAE